jgi:ribonuclease HI
MAPKKWYAVRKGHRTGIFETWDECQAATAGFSGAQYKSFKSAEDAQAYLSGSSANGPPAAAGRAAAAGASAPPSSSSGAAAAAAAAGGGGKFYAVARGRQVGIFDSWPQVGWQRVAAAE